MNKILNVAPTILCTLAVCCMLALAGCTQSGGQTSTEASADASASSQAAAETSGTDTAGTIRATMTVEGYDPITIELYEDSAPATVANFRMLVDQGYYNGLTFYRFVDGFCMQGGTMGNNAAGGDSALKPIEGEFSLNGRSNALADDFKRGTVAMARTTDPDSATSTFFVTLDSSPSVAQALNGQYAAFGTIDEAGMAVVDKIVADHLPYVTDPQMGAIGDEEHQAKIASIVIG